jgi:hypothetical protein
LFKAVLFIATIFFLTHQNGNVSNPSIVVFH